MWSRPNHQSKRLFSKSILSRVDALESVIGKRIEPDDTSSIVDKLDTMNHSMAEMLERTSDPYAPLELIQRHDMGTSPISQTRSLTPSEPRSLRSCKNSLPIWSTREDKAPGPDSSACVPRVCHHIDASSIKFANPTTVLHESATSPVKLGITIPTWFRPPSTPDTSDTSMNTPSQSPQSSSSSFPLTTVDWAKLSGDDIHVAGTQENSCMPEVYFEGRKEYNSLSRSNVTHIVQPEGGSHVPPSRTTYPVPTCDAPLPKDNSASASTGTCAIKVDATNLDSAENSSTEIRTPTRPPSQTAAGSPSSVIDEASVLQMINPPGDSLYDTPSQSTALDIGTDNHHPDGSTQTEPLHFSVIPGQPSSAALGHFTSTRDDELSDLTSISDSNSDGSGRGMKDVERPSKRPRLSRQASIVAELKIKQEHHLPRKRGRSSLHAGTKSGSARGSSFLKTQKLAKKQSKVVVAWPDKVLNDEGSCGTVIQCGSCQLWYHCGCVGFVANDPNLDTLDVFKCPPCNFGVLSTSINKHENCSRPDCTEKGEDGIFFVERIVGRRIKFEGSNGGKRFWLVKWLNYPISRATWEGDDSIGENPKLIEHFIDDLKAEGIEDDFSSNLLLQEASSGGWNLDEPDMAPLAP
ncbi:hypothetical protein F5890DRAFT_1087692 [Lentinula detonsa]|uniref:Chromo domain-containing protein n=1 Tax=Lentinula detonsa TaxID=2804962 RepID=A0AA38Q1Z2_9AGAR|nr:hypothetical protein F5890DRAFT_1087692 [Lentinula detonsa]